MGFDEFFNGRKRRPRIADQLERRRLLRLSKTDRYKAYQTIKATLYAGRIQPSKGELLFYHDVRAKYNAAYHLGARDGRIDPNRVRETR